MPVKLGATSDIIMFTKVKK